MHGGNRFCYIYFTHLSDFVNPVFFPTLGGLRQDDLLSPLIIILVMDALYWTIVKMVEGTFMDGLREASLIVVSYIVCQWHDIGTIGLPSMYPLVFLSWFGSEGRLSELEFFLVREGRWWQVGFQSWILDRWFSNHISWLILGFSFNSKFVWDEVMEWLEKILAGWKRQYLSGGGWLYW